MPSDKIVVGIGGTAGGFNSLQKFFKAANHPFDATIILLQDLDSELKNNLFETIKQHTTLNIVQIAGETSLKPSSVYFPPPGCLLTFKKLKLHPEKWKNDSGRYHSQDRFFSSLAENFRERGIGILLSGSGSSGIMGIEKIRANGGMVIVQEPETAECRDMPVNAVKAGIYDTILSPDEMPACITAYASYAQEKFLNTEKESRKEIVDILHQKTGHDFSNYKANTLKRRIRRQIAINRSGTPENFISLIQEDENALNALFKDLMIGVTGFFRDTEAFLQLEHTVIPEIISGAEKRSAPVRIWIPGCSTGEETYSIAIAFKEQMRLMKTNIPMQIFASDIDQSAIEKARKGLYSSSSVENIPRHLLDEYFEISNDKYRPVKSLRDSVIYSAHSIIKDPPFSRVDLISCRNVMIYLNSSIQKKVMSIFHYALNPDGYLFIGTSETPGESAFLFTEVSAKNRIYRKADIKTPFGRAANFSMSSGMNKYQKINPSNPGNSKLTEPENRLTKALSDIFAPSAVLTDQKGEIIHTHKISGRFFDKHHPEHMTNILSIVKKELAGTVGRALKETAITPRKLVFDNIEIKTPGNNSPVKITVIPSPDSKNNLIFLFEERPSSRSKKPAGSGFEKLRKDNQSYTEALEDELNEARALIHTLTREIDSANEELKSTNEEHLASNEELQSANEELQTSQEELQSMNEELLSLNNELSIKNHELIKANSDIENLFMNIRIAVIFLDKNLRIMRFTRESRKLFNLIHGDIGRPVSHIVNNIEGETDIISLTNQVITDKKSFESEITAKDGSYFWMRIMPYISTKGENNGAVITFNDITEMKLSAEAVRLSEKKYTELYHSMRDGSCEFDTGGTIRVMNEALCGMLGYSPAEIRGKQYTALSPEKWHEMEQKIISEQTAVRGYSELYEKELIRKDGTVFPVELRTYSTKDDDGRISGYWAVIRDITEIKDALRNIRESEKKFKDLVENSSDWIWETDSRGVYTYSSPQCETITGWTPEEIIGRSAFDILPAEQAEKVKKSFREHTLKSNPIKSLENTIVSRDGTIRVLETRAVQLFDSEGNLIGYRGTDRDITERKEREEKIYQSEDRLRNLIENAVDGIIIFNRSGELTDVNSKACELSGHPRQELLRMNIAELFPETLTDDTPFSPDILYSENSLPIEIDLIKKTGKRVPIEINTKAMSDGTQQAIIRDITMKKRTEAEKEKSHRLESLGILAGGIAHDFNNILTSILGNVTLAKLKIRKDPELFDLLSEAETGGFKARDLTHQLLTFSRGGAPIKKDARIEDLIRDSAEFILHGSKTSVSYIFEENLLGVNIDSAQISQVIQNLIINAIQAMPRGGNVEIKASNLRVSQKYKNGLTQGDYVKIEVKDEGIGISRDIIQNIFDPYFTTKQKGSGLGLSICYSIIKKHDGVIEVDSTPGRGSVFAFYLPATESKPPMEQKPEKEHGGIGQLKVLFMDDNKSLQRVAEKILTSFGHSVNLASDGIEALKLYSGSIREGRPYDVVITDLTIPGGMGGMDLLSELILIDPDVKAIVSSGYSNDPVMSEYHEYGFKGVIEKPFEANRFMQTIYSVVKEKA